MSPNQPLNPAPGAGAPTTPPVRDLPPPIAMLGVLFDQLTTAETLRQFGLMIESGRPHYAATANVDFVVQALADLELRRILADADLVLCDGMPLVWASRFLGNPLPERVTGSDIVPQLLAEAERRGWRVFFLGGAADSVARAATNTRLRHPQIQIVGEYSPPFKPLLEMDHEDILRRIQAARPHLLLVAFGCPKQEKWIRMNFERAGVPLSIGVGATIDFLAGAVRRAPRWMQRIGAEWIFRLLQEPRRLFRRYLVDLVVFSRAVLRQWWEVRAGRRAARSRSAVVTTQSEGPGRAQILEIVGRLDAAATRRYDELWPQLAAEGGHVLLNLAGVTFLDSTGAGLLVRLRKLLRERDRMVVLVAPSPPVLRVLTMLRFQDFFPVAPDPAAGFALVQARQEEINVVPTLQPDGLVDQLAWQGDIIAAREEAVWTVTHRQMDCSQARGAEVVINLAAVRFIDSTGVRVMLRARKEARRRGLVLKFTAPSPAVTNVLRILRLESHLLNG